MRPVAPVRPIGGRLGGVGSPQDRRRPGGGRRQHPAPPAPSRAARSGPPPRCTVTCEALDPHGGPGASGWRGRRQGSTRSSPLGGRTAPLPNGSWSGSTDRHRRSGGQGRTGTRRWAEEPRRRDKSSLHCAVVPEVSHEVRRRRPAATGPAASDAEYPPCLHGHALSGSSESSDLPRPGLLTLLGSGSVLGLLPSVRFDSGYRRHAVSGVAVDGRVAPLRPAARWRGTGRGRPGWAVCADCCCMTCLRGLCSAGTQIFVCVN